MQEIQLKLSALKQSKKKIAKGTIVKKTLYICVCIFLGFSEIENIHRFETTMLKFDHFEELSSFRAQAELCRHRTILVSMPEVAIQNHYSNSTQTERTKKQKRG